MLHTPVFSVSALLILQFNNMKMKMVSLSVSDSVNDRDFVSQHLLLVYIIETKLGKIETKLGKTETEINIQLINCVLQLIVLIYIFIRKLSA